MYNNGLLGSETFYKCIYLKFVSRASGWIYQIKSGACEKAPH